MNGFLVTLKKELMSYAVSPVSWIIAVTFYIGRGIELHGLCRYYMYFRGDLDMLPTATYGFGSTVFMSVLVPGILTMRCFAEERRTGSIEALMTAPVRDGEVVLGKWLAATVFFAILWLPTVFELHLLEYGSYLNADISFGPVFAAYLGMFLLSGMLLAFGCFASSLTDNVLLAAVLSVMFNFALIQRMPHQLASLFGDATQNYYLRELLDKIDVNRNFAEWFARGLIDTSQVAFYIGGIAFFLFLTGISLASRRIG